MKARHVAYVAALIVACLWGSTAWSAPRMPASHAYVVHAGDGGWWRIAVAHGVTMQQLLTANHATTATPVRAGQTIQLPASAHDPSKHTKPAAKKPAPAAAKASTR
jgi:LysM repeat protein